MSSILQLINREINKCIYALGWGGLNENDQAI